MGWSLDRWAKLLGGLPDPVPSKMVGVGRAVENVGVQKFGQNPAISAGTVPEDVWSVGGLYPWPTAAAATTIVSGSTSDTPVGDAAGAWTVRVIGLDANYQPLTEDVTMNGQTPVALVNEFYRVFRAYVLTAGSSGINAGDIDVKHGATVLARIDTARGQTQMAIYTTADSYRPYLRQAAAAISGSVTATAEVILFVRPEGGAWRAQFHTDITNSSPQSADFVPASFQVPERTDMRMTVVEATGTGIGVFARFGLLDR